MVIGRQVDIWRVALKKRVNGEGRDRFISYFSSEPNSRKEEKRLARKKAGPREWVDCRRQIAIKAGGKFFLPPHPALCFFLKPVPIIRSLNLPKGVDIIGIPAADDKVYIVQSRPVKMSD